jgi:CheY-like chemotaxis protein
LRLRNVDRGSNGRCHTDSIAFILQACLEHLGDKLHEKRAMPGILMSGYQEQTYKTRSREAGFQEYLEKPVDTDVLREHVARLLNKPA